MALTQRQKFSAALFVGIAILTTTLTVYFYQLFMSANAQVGTEDRVLLIPKGTEYQQLVESLIAEQYIQDRISFMFVARFLGYSDKVRAGRYIVRKDMSNFGLVRLLRSGVQAPVKVTFNNIRLKENLAGKLSSYLSTDSTEFMQKMNDPAFVQTFGFDTTTIVSMFLPDTYEMYWTTEPDEIFKRIKKNYDSFWNAERQTKAKKLGFSPVQVSILASIVEAETKKADEAPKVAGVYLNRLKIKMKLQADPTVVFAHRDFTIKRVTYQHLKFDSPYNTYLYEGLPPAPINLPSPKTIDAVLNAENHEYLYFCAKEDFSGYHTFAKDYETHKTNASRYAQALNEANIR